MISLEDDSQESEFGLEWEPDPEGEVGHSVILRTFNEKGFCRGTVCLWDECSHFTIVYN